MKSNFIFRNSEFSHMKSYFIGVSIIDINWQSGQALSMLPCFLLFNNSRIKITEWTSKDLTPISQQRKIHKTFQRNNNPTYKLHIFEYYIRNQYWSHVLVYTTYNKSMQNRSTHKYGLTNCMPSPFTFTYVINASGWPTPTLYHHWSTDNGLYCVKYDSLNLSFLLKCHVVA